MEEVTNTSVVSSSDSEDDENVGSQGNPTAMNISKKNLSRSNVEDEIDSDTLVLLYNFDQVFMACYALHLVFSLQSVHTGSTC